MVVSKRFWYTTYEVWVLKWVLPDSDLPRSWRPPVRGRPDKSHASRDGKTDQTPVTQSTDSRLISCRNIITLIPLASSSLRDHTATKSLFGDMVSRPLITNTDRGVSSSHVYVSIRAMIRRFLDFKGRKSQPGRHSNTPPCIPSTRAPGQQLESRFWQPPFRFT